MYRKKRKKKAVARKVVRRKRKAAPRPAPIPTHYLPFLHPDEKVAMRFVLVGPATPGAELILRMDRPLRQGTLKYLRNIEDWVAVLERLATMSCEHCGNGNTSFAISR